VVVAVITMRVVQTSIDQVIDMVAVRHGLMSATRAVLVSGAFRFRSAPRRVGLADLDDMFVNVIAMHVMQMTIMEVVNMSIVANRGMSTVWAVLVGMVSVMFLRANCHDSSPFLVTRPSRAS
jgi:hypothetical protein